MKTLSGRFRFVALGVVAIVVVSCCEFPFPLIKDTKSCFELGNYSVELGKLPSNRPKTTYRTYVEWKDQHDFDKALAQVRDHRGKICVCVLLNSRGEPHPHPLNNCSNYHCPSPPPEKIRTVKVTKSKSAYDIAAGESAVNDPHVTYSVQSPDPGDIIAVLDTLKK